MKYRMCLCLGFAACILAPALPLGLTQQPGAATELRGQWSVVALQVDGKMMPQSGAAKQLSFTGNRLVFDGYAGTYVLKPDTNPQAIDLTFADKDGQPYTLPGIFQQTRDTLTLCVPGTNYTRPTELRTTTGDGRRLYSFKRVGDGQPAEITGRKPLFPMFQNGIFGNKLNPPVSVPPAQPGAAANDPALPTTQPRRAYYDTPHPAVLWGGLYMMNVPVNFVNGTMLDFSNQQTKITSPISVFVTHFKWQAGNGTAPGGQYIYDPNGSPTPKVPAPLGWRYPGFYENSVVIYQTTDPTGNSVVPNSITQLSATSPSAPQQIDVVNVQVPCYFWVNVNCSDYLYNSGSFDVGYWGGPASTVPGAPTASGGATGGSAAANGLGKARGPMDR